MEDSLQEMVELLREIRDGIEKTNEHLESIDAKLENISGIWGLDDIHQAIDNMESSITHELKMIDLKLD